MSAGFTEVIFDLDPVPITQMTSASSRNRPILPNLWSWKLQRHQVLRLHGNPRVLVRIRHFRCLVPRMADSQQSDAPPAGGVNQDPASQGAPAAPATLQASSNAPLAVSIEPAASEPLQAPLSTSSAPLVVAQTAPAVPTTSISAGTATATSPGVSMAPPSTTSALSSTTASVSTPAAICALSETSSGTSTTMAAVTTGLAAPAATHAVSGDAAVLMLRPTPSVPAISALQTASATAQSAPVTSTIAGLLHAVEASRYRTEPSQRLPYEPCLTPWYQLTPPGQVVVPATLEDLRDGTLMVCAPDGLSRLVNVTSFSAPELARLSRLMGHDAAGGLLQPLSVPPPDITDPRIGRPWIHTVRFRQGLGQSVGNTSASGAAGFTVRSRSFAQALRSQSEAHQAELQHLQSNHAVALQRAAAGASSGQATHTTAAAEIQKLKENLERANKLGAQFATEKLDADDAVGEAALKITSLESELTVAQKRIAELEAQVLDSRAFDPGAFCDFFVNSSAFKGNWRRFLELLQLYRTGQPVPTGYRTTIQVSARDLDFEDSDPYTTLAAQPSPASVPASSPSGSAQATMTPTSSSLSATPLRTPPMLSLGRSTSAGSSKIRRKALKSLPLAKALASSSSKKVGGLKIQTSAAPSSAAAPETVDLTRSASSTPKAKAPMIKPFTQRIALPRRPTKFKPERKNAKKESPSARSDLDAATAVPNQFSWDGPRPDVQELMLAGVAFWDAVDEVQKDQMLHDQFGRKNLIYMLTSVIQVLRRGGNQTPGLTRIPVPWRALPIKPGANDDDSDSSFMSVLSSEDTDDDDNDQSYHGSKPKALSSISTRSQSSPADKKRQRSSTSSGGSSGTKRQRSASGTSVTSGDPEPDEAKTPEEGVDNGVIEAPKKGSWFHNGIRVQKLHHQTIGFPAYMPSKTGIEQLHKRIEYALIWSCSDQTPELTSSSTTPYWERLHWYPFPPKIDYIQLAKELGLPELATVYRERKDRAQEFELRRRDLVDQLKGVKGYSDRIWFEPGLWAVPKDPCHWILRDPDLKISLADEIFTLDDQEPARTQWATRRSDKQFEAVVPPELKPKSRAERKANPIIPAPEYNHDTLAEVLRALEAAPEEETEEA
ncbi:hypothetical protein PHYSODRAFT_339228 [Phytophthora sojae]|uniref:Uncharacterized protein n=1 Tax=Phytophthora sojae (strain P6497) TaxID=1094619 RepID=G5A640_PHYSP|nr:hypothetical protein PHYSODRAFT_339228 [Phytophthora sojae]EGZ08795.1 hypothetical protein PHYSODRAFT_339228 [Phytophthora sojae]|eukprot:XP_009535428.1 hypothetical protein PHYSODRAFT_339228 [Phytophthora sojae]